jgi:ABC-type bacteriocin/lantibiotic exporter with double-glycine peptidase domain
MVLVTTLALALTFAGSPAGSVPAPAAPLDVPFVAQAKDTCGAAALAMVLAYWGTSVPHADIAAALLEPELHGILGSRLAAFAEQRGFRALAYAGDADHLRAFLAKGRPLIVALGAARGRFHNVVVVGFDAARDAWLVNDPALGAARPMPRAEFERRWAQADRWTLLVLPRAPGPSPAASPAAAPPS